MFRKCSNLDIPKQVGVYIFHYGLHPEYCNIADVSIGGSVVTTTF